MYRVEVLPGSSTHATPGWTYVPDRGFDPAKAAIAPTLGRKRGIREPGRGTDLSSRQTNAIIRHLAELDRENHKDVQIPIPVKQQPKEAALRGRTQIHSVYTARNELDAYHSSRDRIKKQGYFEREAHPPIPEDVPKLP